MNPILVSLMGALILGGCAVDGLNIPTPAARSAQTADDKPWPNWPEEAYAAYHATVECHAKTPDKCAAIDCKAIEKQADWIGALCMSDQAFYASDEKTYNKEMERAFKLYSDAHKHIDKVFMPGYQQANLAKGETRAVILGEYLTNEILGHVMAKSFIKEVSDAKKDVETHRARAEAGDAQAQFDYAWDIQHKGLKSKRENSAEAAIWYRKAADQGHALAQFNLGIMHAKGEGVPQNDSLAVTYYRKAAEQGHADAQNNFGSMYAQGRGVPLDIERAVEWQRKAADQGNALAQYNLGERYSAGLGVRRDDLVAANWYRKAADQGYAPAQLGLGSLYEAGLGVPKDHNLALEWYRRAAEQGDPSAQFTMGVKYAKGDGVPQNTTLALEWYRKAADQNEASAQNNLGAMYAKGEGVPQDYKIAVEWYHKAAENGYSVAQSNLGALYSKGEGVPRDDRIALEWYQKAADQGYANAQVGLGSMYADGRGVPRNDPLAVEWYRKAAEQGNVAAQVNLGYMYANGRGVAKDLAWAVYWNALAAQQSEAQAVENLKRLSESMTKFRLTKPTGNLRAEPRKDGELVGTLHQNDIVYSLSIPEGGWRRVYVPDGHKTGYMSESLLSALDSRTAPAASNAGPYPPPPAAQPEYLTCSTRCFNGDCYRTYSNGKQVHFQAQMKWDPMTNQMGWDSGGC